MTDEIERAFKAGFEAAHRQALHTTHGRYGLVSVPAAEQDVTDYIRRQHEARIDRAWQAWRRACGQSHKMEG